MKIKSILPIADLFLALTSHCFAQGKPTITPQITQPPIKVEYVLNPNSRVALDGSSFTIGQLNNFILVCQNGVDVVKSTDKLNGAQITIILKDYQMVTDSLNSRLQRFVRLDHDRWAADTGKVVKKK